MNEGMDFELLAASLRADAGDAGAFLEALAAKLGGALPHRVRVERGGGLFSHGHPVRRLSVSARCRANPHRARGRPQERATER